METNEDIEKRNTRKENLVQKVTDRGKFDPLLFIVTENLHKMKLKLQNLDYLVNKGAINLGHQ